MTRRVVLLLDWRNVDTARMALQIILASLPPEVDLEITIAVDHNPEAPDAASATELVSLLGAIAQRISYLEVENIRDVNVTSPFLTLQVGSLDRTIDQVCDALSRVAAQSLDGRNTVEVIHAIDPNRF